MPSCSDTEGDIMKSKHRLKTGKKPNLANPTVLPNAAWHDEKQIRNTVEFVMTPTSTRPTGKNQENASIAEVEFKTLAAIATCAWKAKTRLKDARPIDSSLKNLPSHSEQVIFQQVAKKNDEILTRVTSDIGRIWNALVDDLGLEIKDHTQEVFDYGLPLKIVTTRPTAGISKERVVETIKPTIRWRNRMIQVGEVIIETPV